MNLTLLLYCLLSGRLLYAEGAKKVADSFAQVADNAQMQNILEGWQEENMKLKDAEAKSNLEAAKDAKAKRDRFSERYYTLAKNKKSQLKEEAVERPLNRLQQKIVFESAKSIVESTLPGASPDKTADMRMNYEKSLAHDIRKNGIKATGSSLRLLQRVQNLSHSEDSTQ